MVERRTATRPRAGAAGASPRAARNKSGGGRKVVRAVRRSTPSHFVRGRLPGPQWCGGDGAKAGALPARGNNHPCLQNLQPGDQPIREHQPKRAKTRTRAAHARAPPRLQPAAQARRRDASTLPTRRRHRQRAFATRWRAASPWRSTTGTAARAAVPAPSRLHGAASPLQQRPRPLRAVARRKSRRRGVAQVMRRRRCAAGSRDNEGVMKTCARSSEAARDGTVSRRRPRIRPSWPSRMLRARAGSVPFSSMRPRIEASGNQHAMASTSAAMTGKTRDKTKGPVYLREGWGCPRRKRLRHSNALPPCAACRDGDAAQDRPVHCLLLLTLVASPRRLPPRNAAAISTPSSPQWRATRRRRRLARGHRAGLRRPDARPAVLAFDRRQAHAFRRKGSFEEFAATRVAAGAPQARRQADAAPRRAACAHRAAVRRAQGIADGDLDAWKATTAPATWASCR